MASVDLKKKHSATVSMKQHTKHLFNLADKWFHKHYSFLFTVFNILQCCEILLHCSLKVKCEKFDSVAHSFAALSQDAVHLVMERVACGDSFIDSQF
jgi:hypothetical protein